jgi:hypothetical protein
MDAFFLEHVLPAEYEERSVLKRHRDETHEHLVAANGRICELARATDGVLLIGNTLQQLIDGKNECDRRNSELTQQLSTVLKTAKEEAKKNAEYDQAQRNSKRKKEVDDVYTAILYLLRSQPVDSSVDKVMAGIAAQLERVRFILDN